MKFIGRNRPSRGFYQSLRECPLWVDKSQFKFQLKKRAKNLKFILRNISR